MDKESIYREVKRRVDSDPCCPEKRQGGDCFFTAMYAVQVLRQHGHRAIIQAGSCQWPRVKPAQDDGKMTTHFGYQWSPNEVLSQIAVASDLMPEIHIWAALPVSGQIVDFSTGLFPEQARQFLGVDWPGEQPPQFFWGTKEELPEDVVYKPDVQAITYVLKKAVDRYGHRFVSTNLL